MSLIFNLLRFHPSSKSYRNVQRWLRKKVHKSCASICNTRQKLSILVMEHTRMYPDETLRFWGSGIHEQWRSGIISRNAPTPYTTWLLSGFISFMQEIDSNSNRNQWESTVVKWLGHYSDILSVHSFAKGQFQPTWETRSSGMCRILKVASRNPY
jgi:hypothetical protein